MREQDNTGWKYPRFLPLFTICTTDELHDTQNFSGEGAFFSLLFAKKKKRGGIAWVVDSSWWNSRRSKYGANVTLQKSLRLLKTWRSFGGMPSWNLFCRTFPKTLVRLKCNFSLWGKRRTKTLLTAAVKLVASFRASIKAGQWLKYDTDRMLSVSSDRGSYGYDIAVITDETRDSLQVHFLPTLITYTHTKPFLSEILQKCVNQRIRIFKCKILGN